MSETCKAFIFTSFILCVVDVIESTQTKLPSDLQDVLRKYGNYDIDDIIDAKIAGLIPLLDDNKILNKEEIKENGRKEVAVMPLTEHDATNRNSYPINKQYKKMRKDIEKLLKTEQVSKNTRRSVVDALDRMTMDLLNNECIQKRTERQRTEMIVKHIQEKWDKVVKKFSMKNSKPNSNNQKDAVRKAFEILTGLRQFIFDVHEDYKELESRYTMKCDFIDKTRIKKGDKNKGETIECSNVPICSKELQSFLRYSYKKIQDTNFNVLANVVSMYHKNIDFDEELMKKFFKDLKDSIKKEMHEIASQSVDKLDLGSDWNPSRIETLKRMIDKMVGVITNFIMSQPLHLAKPSFRIMEDLRTTASTEFENLRTELKNSICSVFQTCNGAAAAYH